ncbi:Mediator of RNA polymerase II transcription subunit 34 [Gracilariopsis chorda]|uniref:ATP-dependent DNA helicase n=1 Tax=Gracilariopsis chorda TaxID=448386 RepID=A0A2V3IZ40_9FLOR|nr:Mediator of RNA polymerase II transcription subunit 34 [Gracilariopsis chorda]|eukprot:PXF47426.1 Mediator of RNA polymerase II transcription subunit 34 [Gracilariopsis chorda]
MPADDRHRDERSSHHRAGAVEHDELVARLSQRVVHKRRQVADAHRRLTRLSSELASLEKRLADRQKLLKRRADAAFNWLKPCPWDRRLKQATDAFGISSFRPLQPHALNATLMARDVFAILPTGAGKSLIYQLAAVVDAGLTLVVSPLLSLSMDQRAALRGYHIRAECLHSEITKQQQKAIYSHFIPSDAFAASSKHPRKKWSREQPWCPDDVEPLVLFVTPEQVARSKRLLSRLEILYENGHLSRICIDEAHCCSSWGHDFRHDYRKLAILRRQCPSTPILALTATCDPNTVEDVCNVLEMKHPVIFRGSIDRPNLFYEVRQKADTDKVVIQDIASWLKTEFKGQCGIIYVLSRKEAHTYATQLAQLGTDTDCYHSDMDITHRNAVHRQWSDNKLQVVVATIAFGLGIDHPHVRFIIHATIATSLEAYYQESGRAGRDGLPAKCIVLQKPKDFARMSAFVADKGQSRIRKLYAMYEYACSRGLHSRHLCRRQLIAKAFGDTAPNRTQEQLATCCDLCAARCGAVESSVVSIDVSYIARDLLSMIELYVEQYPDKKTTILKFATDWGKNSKSKAQRSKSDRSSMAKLVDVNTRVEILVQLVLSGALQETHRHSSYSMQAYVTTNDVQAALRRRSIDVTLWKKDAERLLAAKSYLKTERSDEGMEKLPGDDKELSMVDMLMKKHDDSEVVVIDDSDESIIDGSGTNFLEHSGDSGNRSPRVDCQLDIAPNKGKKRKRNDLER